MNDSNQSLVQKKKNTKEQKQRTQRQRQKHTLQSNFKLKIKRNF